jgi:SOS-response transcriptional repressor LexA
MAPVMLSLFGIHRPIHCGLGRVTGDSMIDVGIYGGDYCLFDMDDKYGDGIFMLTMYGDTRIKRLHYRLAERKIIIASENRRRYPDPEVVSAEIAESGQLIVHGRVLISFHLIIE